MGAVSAGFALLPDLDHPSACASKALGRPVHRVVHSLCKKAVRATALGRDRNYIRYQEGRGRDPYHRTLTHALLVAAGLGVLAYTLTWLSMTATGLMAAFGVFLMWPLHRKAIGLVAACAAGAAVGAVLLLNPWLMALAVAGGYASHIVADGCTAAGVPALWPMKIQGKRWWNIRLLGGMVSSGSLEERGPAIGVSMAFNASLVLLSSANF